MVEVGEDILAGLVHGPAQARDLSDPGVFHANKGVNERTHAFLGCLLVGIVVGADDLLVVVPGLL